jgi:hypothetical protein
VSRFNPSDSKQVSQAAAVHLSRILSSVACKDGGPTGRRGFAIQHLGNEHLRMLSCWANDTRPFMTAALASALIDKVQANQEVRTIVAGWLDDVVALGVGKEQADAWLGAKAQVQTSATASVSGLAALVRGPAPAPATPAPAAAPAVDLNTLVAAAVAQAVAQVQASNADLIKQLMEQNAALMVSATKSSGRKAKSNTVEVTVAAAAEDANGSEA